MSLAAGKMRCSPSPCCTHSCVTNLLAKNWDVVGGISFKKGCYPGQEIVARMQYLGRLKERLYAFRTDADDVTAGARLFSATFGDEPCGAVVNAAPDPTGGSVLLAVVQSVAVAAHELAILAYSHAADGFPNSFVMVKGHQRLL